MAADDEPDLPDLRRSRAERAASAVLPACAVEWAAAEVLSLAHASAEPLVIGTAVAASLAFGASGRTHRVAPYVAWAIAGAGGWLSAAVTWGPANWPLAATWATASLYAAWKARMHPAVVEAREWRQARADWLADCRKLGLHGSHLLDHEWTRLGEDYVVDVSGTGKLASAVARSSLAEVIAARRRIPKSRVTVTEEAVAGELRISVRDFDPWADPIIHPLLDPEPQEFLAPADEAVISAVREGARCTIRRPVPVGQDPATGRILWVPLWDEHGGKNVNIVGIKGSGKGVLLNDISERVTAAPDALMIRVNISKKGAAEVRRWGPACHLTAFGPEEADRALKVLRCISGIIDWRSRQHYDTDVFIPSAADPLIVLIMDEIGAAMKYAKIRAELENIATTGRELGVTAVRAGQRGTAQWTGGSDVRSQDDVFCLGAVNRSTEAMHAAGELGLRLPDMASYGEGKPGVWVVAELGDQAGHAGRTWKLSEPQDVARIAAERATSQPDLPSECKAFLGDDYEQLLGTDVFARWAHDDAGDEDEDGDDAGEDFTAPRPQAPPRRPATAAVAAPEHAAVITDDPIERLDFDMDDVTRSRFRALDEKLGRAREILAETAAMPPGPDVPAEKLRESSEERWRQVGEQADLSPQHRETLLGLLQDGTTIAAATEALGVSTWTARSYLQKLRNEGLARIDGKGRGARWRTSPGNPVTLSDNQPGSPES